MNFKDFAGSSATWFLNTLGKMLEVILSMNIDYQRHLAKLGSLAKGLTFSRLHLNPYDQLKGAVRV